MNEFDDVSTLHGIVGKTIKLYAFCCLNKEKQDNPNKQRTTIRLSISGPVTILWIVLGGSLHLSPMLALEPIRRTVLGLS